MISNPKSTEDQEDLNKRLRSLKIDRGAVTGTAPKNRSPKFLFLGIAVLLALLAFGYIFLFSTTKTISAAPVRVETGGSSSGESVLSFQGRAVVCAAAMPAHMHKPITMAPFKTVHRSAAALLFIRPPSLSP